MGYTDGSRCGDKVGHGALPARASRGRIRGRGGHSLDGEGQYLQSELLMNSVMKIDRGGIGYLANQEKKA